MEDPGHKIVMTGATGFVGTNLSRGFNEQGWERISLSRKDITSGGLAGIMEGADIIVNLAGAPVIHRWTDEYKKTMYESRVNVTRNLVKACLEMDSKPKTFISTSAIGHYASSGTHTEEHHMKAEDFLGRLTRDWEHEALQAREVGMRTVIFRFGVVLGKGGGALEKMLTPFKAGLGGTIGDGSQPFSWIHIQDLIRAFNTAIQDVSWEGIFNLTSPGPTTNKGLTRALGEALGRPTFMSIPRFVLRLQLGEGAQVLTGGQKVIPKRLLDRGFTFLFSDIDEAVRDCVSV